MQRDFDEAVIRKWITASQVRGLSASFGVPGARRDYFTAEEVSRISGAFPAWIAEGRTSQSRNIRELLFFYFNFAVHTGLRPGSEMDNLKWNDIQIRPDHVVTGCEAQFRSRGRNVCAPSRSSLRYQSRS